MDNPEDKISQLIDHGIYKRNQVDKEKIYQIDFGNHLRCKIKVVDNIIEVQGAINGWGDIVPDIEIKILELKYS